MCGHPNRNMKRLRRDMKENQNMFFLNELFPDIYLNPNKTGINCQEKKNLDCSNVIWKDQGSINTRRSTQWEDW